MVSCEKVETGPAEILLQKRINFEQLKAKIRAKVSQITQVFGGQLNDALIILDLDGTVVCNWPRQLQIYQQDIISHFPHLGRREIAQALQESPPLYSLIAFLYKWCQNETEWQQLQRIFSAKFLSGHYSEYDQIDPLFRDFVQWAVKNRFKIAFLTGRPHREMFTSTQSTLLTQLPELENAKYELWMKDLDIPDIAFKREKLRTLKSHPAVNILAFVDNESEICSMAQEILGASVVTHYNSTEAASYPFDGWQLQNV